MPDDKNESCCADIRDLVSPGMFKALSDPNRVAILARLAEAGRACTVSEVASCCPVNISVVSRHLAKLRDAGILTAVKKGKEVYYSLCCQPLADSLRSLARALETCCQGTACDHGET